MLRRPAAVLLGLFVLAAGAGGTGCADDDPRDDGRANREPVARQDLRPAVSPGESLRVIDDYVTGYNKAVAGADGRAWRGLLADPMAAMADARLRIGRGRPPERHAITLVNPVLFVPKLDASFPKWFVVAAMQRVGPRGKPHQVLLLFTRSAPDALWRLANMTVTSAKLPKIATDGQGYAVAVSAEQQPRRLAVPLGNLANAHAAYLSNDASRTFADGSYTSGWRAERAAGARRARAGGWLGTVAFGQTRYSPAALRTKDGGILAWYAVSRVDSFVADRSSRSSSPGQVDRPGGSEAAAPDPGAISADIRGYLDRPFGGARTEVRAAWLLLPLTYVPPGGGRPAVLGQTTGLTSAAAIEH